jgi:hypothetical protein
MSTSPHVKEGYSPLEQLALRALRRYGETAPSTVEPELLLSFVDYANWIIDQIHVHPYNPVGHVLRYYNHITDSRAIPDHVVVSGLLYKHAFDNGSQKTGGYMGEFQNTLSALLHQVRFGASPEYEFKVVDYQSQKVLE